MSVEFILGRSGTGKTRRCVEGVLEGLLREGDGREIVLLVPEQATYQAERAILSGGKVGGYHRLGVLSFNRLEYMLVGGRQGRRSVSRTGRAMILQRILREKRDELKLLGPSAERSGLAGQLGDLIGEIWRYGCEVEQLERVAALQGERGAMAGRKFAEIAMVVKEYLEFIEGKAIDPDMQLAKACDKVREADRFCGAEIWVDGFASFTGSELAMLTELMKVASEMHIALCLDPQRVNLNGSRGDDYDVSIFSPTERTYYDLYERAKKCKLKIENPVLLTEAKRFERQDELSHIEKHIFSGSQHSIGCSDAVQVVSQADRRAEVGFAARRIVELVRESGYRYRDIAVVASDLAVYEHYIEGLFGDYGIPVFIDRRKKLNQHPAVELVGCALRIVTGVFASNDVFAYLKTDLAGVERGDVDILENYCVAFGVGGTDWKRDKAWEYAGDSGEVFCEEKVNEVRERVRGPLMRLAERVGTEQVQAEKFTGAVFELLEELGVRKTLAEWIERANSNGDIETADEHRQFWEKFVDVFDELCEAFEGCSLGCGDYVSILESAFSQMATAFIPPTLDQVLAGAIERSRHPDLKAVFLIGATQKEFPTPMQACGILSDEDRAAAERAGVELGPGRRTSVLERQYLAYIAFTRASQRLYVTYPRVDEKGGGVVRSQFVDSLESLFDNLQAEPLAADDIGLEQVCSEAELSDLLCCGLGADADKTGGLDELLGAVCSDAELKSVGQRVKRALDYDNEALLDGDIITRVYSEGEELRSSATRLGAFAQCPYQYFARYVLDLKERAEFKLEPLDVGDFYHKVLDGVVKKLAREKLDIATVGDERLSKLVRLVSAEVLEGNSFIKTFAGHSRHNAFVLNCACENAERCVAAVAEMVRAGRFRPVRSEAGFGVIAGQRGELGDLLIELADGRRLNLRGKIDRIDVAEADGARAAIVFDYKRTGRSFSWDGFFYGLDLQLVIYLLAIGDSQRGKQTVGIPVGAFYMPVEVGAEGKEYAQLESEEKKFLHKAKGIFNGEYAGLIDADASGASRYYNFHVKQDGQPYGYPNRSSALRGGDFERVIEFGRGKVVELAEGIVSGGIEVRPYQLRGKSACSWCKYKSLCRFDWQVNEYRYLEGMGKTEVLGRIGDGKKD